MLIGVTLCAQLLPLIAMTAMQGQSVTGILLPSTLFILVLTTPAVIIGTLLGPKINLGLFNQDAIEARRRGLIFALIVGVLLGAALLTLRHFVADQLPDSIPAYGFRGVLGGFLVSVSASIGEEVWFRFGLMTLMLWFVAKLQRQDRPSPLAAMLVITIVAFAFGLAHIPQLVSYSAANVFAVWATILGNVAVGVLYGWCYWRHGLISAIVAHFSLDIVLHMLPALV